VEGFQSEHRFHFDRELRLFWKRVGGRNSRFGLREGLELEEVLERMLEGMLVLGLIMPE